MGSVEPFTDGSIISAAGQNKAHWRHYTQQGLNLLRQLMDRSIEFSKGNLEGWGEAYVDSDGQLNSVNINKTIALFDTNKYKPTDYSGSVTSDLTTNYTSTYNISGKSGIVVTALTDSTITKVTISSSVNATKAYIYDENLNLLSSATISSYEAIFSQDLTAGEIYYIVCDSEGSSYTEHRGLVTLPYNDAILKIIAGQDGDQALGNYYNNMLYSIKTVEFSNIVNSDKMVVHTIPSGTFPSNINAAIGVPFIEDWEDGADIQYKLTNSSEDSGWLDNSEVNTFTAFTSEPTTLIVKLIPKSSSPTAGTPSIKAFYVNAWNDN